MRRILVAEDVPSQQKLLATVLKKAGHSVVCAGNGQEALDLVRQEAFDLILMDVQMPGMNGLDAIRAIRGDEAQSGGHVHIVAVTAHALTGDAERCLQAGADAHLSKPIDLARMMHLLSELLAKQRC